MLLQLSILWPGPGGRRVQSPYRGQDGKRRIRGRRHNGSDRFGVLSGTRPG